MDAVVDARTRALQDDKAITINSAEVAETAMNEEEGHIETMKTDIIERGHVKVEGAEARTKRCGIVVK